MGLKHICYGCQVARGEFVYLPDLGRFFNLSVEREPTEGGVFDMVYASELKVDQKTKEEEIVFTKNEKGELIVFTKDKVLLICDLRY